eukprot:2634327-Pyramimonas_sp.AAC.2
MSPRCGVRPCRCWHLAQVYNVDRAAVFRMVENIFKVVNTDGNETLDIQEMASFLTKLYGRKWTIEVGVTVGRQPRQRTAVVVSDADHKGHGQ